MTERIALVTGGSRGLGKNAVLKLAADGTGIILTVPTQSAGRTGCCARNSGKRGQRGSIAAQRRGYRQFSTRLPCSYRKSLSLSGSVTRFDYLLNNAGTGLFTPYAETTEAQFDEALNIHFKGPFFLTQRLLPLLNDGGRILNVSSGLARFTQPGSGTYAAMKGAMEVLTRYQAKELGARGISVNIIAPGAIETDFWWRKCARQRPAESDCWLRKRRWAGLACPMILAMPLRRC